MTCKHCGGPLGRQIETVYFKDGDKQLYYPHNFAMWHANAKGHDPDSVVEWLQSARGDKKGLVMGYRVPTDRPGHDGRGEYCSMDCAAAAAGDRATAASDAAPHARPANVTDLQAMGKIDGAELRRIRKRLGMSQPAFAVAMGYTGDRDARQTMISRIERGQRDVPERVRLRAIMLDNGAKERGL